MGSKEETGRQALCVLAGMLAGGMLVFAFWGLWRNTTRQQHPKDLVANSASASLQKDDMAPRDGAPFYGTVEMVDVPELGKSGVKVLRVDHDEPKPGEPVLKVKPGAIRSVYALIGADKAVSRGDRVYVKRVDIGNLPGSEFILYAEPVANHQ